MRKKLTYFLTMCLFLFTLTGCMKQNIAEQDIVERIEKEPTITWGVKIDTKLFGLYNIEKSEIEGFDIDIAKELTKRILGPKGKAEFVEVTSKTRIPLLKNGNIDGIIATMTITDERKQVVDFSDVYFEAGQSLLVKKGSTIQSIKDLNADTTVLAVKGSTSATNIRKAAPDAKILELENYAEAYTALKSGQGDAVTTDNAILYGMASEDSNYEVVGGIFTDEPYGIAINKNQEAFVKEIDQALAEMKADGTYQKIYQKWLPDATNEAK
ncbi:glutamate ABC transporter substrate-binding protein [Isobaculum melis]|uniref:Amino acid ABC transporter substrate-binding protein, PAAT family n=1 Tax=Isobaculum melis TaxID=142588 RepID=A0A1H9QTL0_9LACT|nr:amino acid ABC transporter substrate-binding protein, PAAT family [Isobaculum melis]